MILVIAGEPSGDNLGGRLMTALRRRTGDRIRFAGIGGPAMTSAGLNSLFPMSDLSVMGLAEILPHLPKLVGRIRETVAAIERLRPTVVLTIDSPAFSLRVARRIRHTGIPVVHYVAPQLWAWRPGRGRKLAGVIDHILALLPFEPDFFAEFGVPCTFVGHPILESRALAGEGAAFRRAHDLADDTPLVAVLSGSRGIEVRRLLPVFGAGLERLAEGHRGLTAAVVTVDAQQDAVAAAIRSWRVPTILVEGAAKYDAFAASDAAITKSGTITLELAVAGVPMVVCHRLHPVTAVAARRLIKVPNVALVNLLAERQLAAELLQERCTPDEIATALARLLDSEPARAAQRAGFQAVIDRLGGLDPTPSERAADAVLQFIADRRAAAPA